MSVTSTLQNTGNHSQLTVRAFFPSDLDNTLDVTFLFFAKHVKSHSYMVKELRILSILSLPSHQRQQSLAIHHSAVTEHFQFLRTPLAAETLYRRAHSRPRHHRPLRWCSSSDLPKSGRIVARWNVSLREFHVETYGTSVSLVALIEKCQNGQFPRLRELNMIGFPVSTKWEIENDCFTCRCLCRRTAGINFIWKTEFNSGGKNGG